MTEISHIHIEPTTGFGLNNLPFGIFSRSDSKNKQVGVAIGDMILDLGYLEQENLIGYKDYQLFNQCSLNLFASLGKEARQDIRQQIQQLLKSSHSKLAHPDVKNNSLVAQNRATMHYPFDTRGYTDFYSCENHARNVGTLFRDPENALNKNWKQLPVAYHGRTSTLVASGIEFKRPHGQILKPGESQPSFSPSQKLDFEIEMGMFIGSENNMFEPIPIQKARDSVFGFVIVNDWSARDIQAWEYVPLGPFLGKNFLTSVSPWVITPEALEPFIAEMPAEDFEPVEYLRQQQRTTFNIELQASITTADGHSEVISTTNFNQQYWSLDQQIAHHTVNGCKLQAGDLLATGTLSGKFKNALGCLLEMTQNGKEPLQLSNGTTRTFLENGDTLTIAAYCKNDQDQISFGSVSGTVVE